MKSIIKSILGAVVFIGLALLDSYVLNTKFLLFFSGIGFWIWIENLMDEIEKL